jgi:hypothetical protein
MPDSLWGRHGDPAIALRAEVEQLTKERDAFFRLAVAGQCLAEAFYRSGEMDIDERGIAHMADELDLRSGGEFTPNHHLSNIVRKAAGLEPLES